MVSTYMTPTTTITDNLFGINNPVITFSPISLILSEWYENKIVPSNFKFKSLTNDKIGSNFEVISDGYELSEVIRFLNADVPGKTPELMFNGNGVFKLITKS
ncbi:hypothetical protein WICMUC_005222 [Wickerhamomyces mucosus]|uniref:Uncharacterized protein n=1 Tax=Wickerhamomyces mucosus TaxID=1378264 RepID=A0A9P8P9K9_9ASCO|nr:hypothetical protein WICMUC_005222 [Wickerhamomyces mucosus]